MDEWISGPPPHSGMRTASCLTASLPPTQSLARERNWECPFTPGAQWLMSFLMLCQINCAKGISCLPLTQGCSHQQLHACQHQEHPCTPNNPPPSTYTTPQTPHSPGEDPNPWSESAPARRALAPRSVLGPTGRAERDGAARRMRDGGRDAGRGPG